MATKSNINKLIKDSATGSVASKFKSIGSKRISAEE